MARKTRQRVGSVPLFEAEYGPDYCREHRLCVECGGRLTGRRQRWCSDDCVDAYRVRGEPTLARLRVLQRDDGVCASCGLDCLAVQQEVEAATEAANEEWWEREGRDSIWGRSGYHRRPPPVVLYKDWENPEAHWGRAAAQGPYVVPARKRVLARYGMEAHWLRDTFWDADHVVPVSEGGGDLGLENLQTLCLACHAEDTARAARRRAARQRLPGPKRIPRRPGERCRNRSGNYCRGEVACWGCRKYRERVLGLCVTGRGAG